MRRRFFACCSRCFCGKKGAGGGNGSRPGENGRDGGGRGDRHCAAAGLALLSVSLLLQLLARGVSGFGQWYAVTIYPLLVGTLGRVSGVFPFSLTELFLYLLIAFCLIYGWQHRARWRCLLSRTFLLISILLFLYTVNCGVNYYRLPFSRYLELPVENYTKEELTELCWYMTERLNSAYDRVSAEYGLDPGEGTSRAALSASAYAGEAVKAMNRLGAVCPALAGYYPGPKRLLFSRILSVQQLAGIYSPFAVEANYNGEMTPYNIPHTVCHELSHLRGFMREDEANFIGFLACAGSEEPQFAYSGWALGWIYAGNALYLEDPGEYFACFQSLSDGVKRDFSENSLFWGRFDTRVAEVSDKLNDAYLKANSQAEGTKSYGRAVDLMLAWYKAGGFDGEEQGL